MSFLDDTMGDFQHQAEVMGQNAAQGAINTAQQALPGFLDQAGQFAQGQLQTAATTVAPAARDLGREAGKGAREGIGDLGTTEKLLLGAGGVALLSLIGFAVYKASRPSRKNALRGGFSPDNQLAVAHAKFDEAVELVAAQLANSKPYHVALNKKNYSRAAGLAGNAVAEAQEAARQFDKASRAAKKLTNYKKPARRGKASKAR